MRDMAPLALGIDFGTESARALLVDVTSGEELASESFGYPHGVLDTHLLTTGAQLPRDWALQHPGDYLEALRRVVPATVAASGADPARIIGIGVDFTSCTVLPATATGTPLAFVGAWRDRPHAWPKLWKHHAAQPLAERMTDVALARGEAFLERYGGRISSEWLFPKLGQILLEDPEVYEATDVFVEAADWIVWQLCGTLCRSASVAGFKALWWPERGLPSEEYLEAVVPGLGRGRAKVGSKFAQLGTRAGTLTAEMASALGLSTSVAVAVGNIDSIVCVPGCGVADPGVFVSVVGTSICDMVIEDREVLVPGITGVVRDGILPGYFGYEAGQPAVGDMFAWYADRLLARGDYVALESGAARVRPGESGLVALDWFNGNRSVLADANLSGVICGLSLRSTPEEVYRALLESVAFGARVIVDNFEEHGVRLSKIVTCGGIAEKSPLLMQLFASVTRRRVEVAGSSQVSARGSALLGAVAGGALATITDAAAALALPPAATYEPDPTWATVYDRLFGIYRELHDHFGRDSDQLMRRLKEIGA